MKRWFASSLYYRIESADQFPIEVTARLMLPGAVWHLVAYEDSTGHAMSRTRIDGIDVVVIHGPATSKVQPAMQAYFVLANYLFYVDAPAVPPEDLVSIVGALVRGYRSPLEREIALQTGSQAEDAE